MVFDSSLSRTESQFLDRPSRGTERRSEGEEGSLLWMVVD